MAEATFRRVRKSVTWTLYAYEGAGHNLPRELRADLGDELRQAYQLRSADPRLLAAADALGGRRAAQTYRRW